MDLDFFQKQTQKKGQRVFEKKKRFNVKNHLYCSSQFGLKKLWLYFER